MDSLPVGSRIQEASAPGQESLVSFLLTMKPDPVGPPVIERQDVAGAAKLALNN